MKRQVGRYSKYIKPISISIDLLTLFVFTYFFAFVSNINGYNFIIYQLTIWILIAYFIGLYRVYRFTTPVEILTKIARQSIVFLLTTLSYFPFFKSLFFDPIRIAIYLTTCFTFITLFKTLQFFYLKKYRIITGANFRNIIIIGFTKEARKLKELFETRIDFGYRFLGFFSDKFTDDAIQGKLDSIKQFALANKVDEIYCSLDELSDHQVKNLVQFSDINNMVVKFIPDTKEIFTKNLKLDYYEFFPILSIQKTALHDPFIKSIKRLFDIAFSLFVIVFILLWLIPLMAILIKLESNGPVFFKQSRPGMNEDEFFCFKFRSMRVNNTSEKEASKNDPRVTRIGKFIRKTSIDELPQFFNVLKGDMSVVGPRPHLWSQNKLYGAKVKKYMVRLYVKPGITGLAQVRGFRGEIETDEDMINRIKYDVFYIENWSMLLDLKIIVQTVINIFKGEDKAY